MFVPRWPCAYVLQESVRAIGKIKMMFFMPLIQCAAIVAFLVPWVIYAVYTASMADVSPLLFTWSSLLYCCCATTVVRDAGVVVLVVMGEVVEVNPLVVARGSGGGYIGMSVVF